MPVFTEFITEASAQDQQDLDKIYAELPKEQASNFETARAQGQMLVGARFNGRLLAAALLHMQGEFAQLSFFNVRTVTRKRGVARRFLTQLRESPLPVNIIKISFCDENEETAAAMTAMGFTRKDNSWQAAMTPNKAIH